MSKKHGKDLSEYMDDFICSECGLNMRDICRYEYDEDGEYESCYEYIFSYCPRCGVKIDREE